MVFFGFLGFFGAGLPRLHHVIDIFGCPWVGPKVGAVTDARKAVFFAFGAVAPAGTGVGCKCEPLLIFWFFAMWARLEPRGHIFPKVGFLGLLHASEVVNEAGHVFSEGLGKEGVHFLRWWLVGWVG